MGLFPFLPFHGPFFPEKSPMQRFFLSFSGALLWVFAFPGPSAAGQEQAPLKQEKKEKKRVGKLQEVKIRAGRRERSLLGLPYTVSLLPRRLLLDERMARTLPEALEEEPGVMVQETSRGQGSPYIRGFTGYRTLLMVDGIRFNNSLFRSGPNQYFATLDPLSLGRVELLKGPASVLYGSDAVGGAILAFTPELPNLGPGNRFRGRTILRWASAERTRLGRQEALGSLLGGKIRFLLGGDLKYFGDLQGGRSTGKWPHTGYTEWDGDTKIEYHPDAKSKFVFLHQHVRVDDAWRTHKTIFGKSWKGTSTGRELKRSLDQERDLTYLQYRARDLGPALSSFTASLSLHTQKEERSRDRLRSGQPRHDLQGFRVDTWGAWIQGVTPTEAGDWTWGAEFYRDGVQSHKREWRNGVYHGASIQGPVADDADYESAALFLRDELDLGRGFALAAGGRYTWNRVKAHSVQDPVTGNRTGLGDRFDAVVGSLRASWTPPEGDGTLYAGLSQAFRAPNLSDLTRFDSARTNEIETPSPGLDPEHYLTFEVGGRLEEGSLRGEAAYFYTWIRDMIIRRPTGRTIGGENEVTKENAGDGYVHGIEGRLSWEFLDGLSFFTAGTWIYGAVDTYPSSLPEKKRQPLSRLMPPSGNFGLRWDLPQRNLWAEALVLWAAKADKLNTRDRADTQRIPPGGTPGYVVLGFRGGWEFRKDMVLSLAVENVTDKDYRIHGSGQNQPGTNLVLGLDLQF